MHTLLYSSICFLVRSFLYWVSLASLPWFPVWYYIYFIILLFVLKAFTYIFKPSSMSRRSSPVVGVSTVTSEVPGGSHLFCWASRFWNRLPS